MQMLSIVLQQLLWAAFEDYFMRDTSVLSAIEHITLCEFNVDVDQ